MNKNDDDWNAKLYISKGSNIRMKWEKEIFENEKERYKNNRLLVCLLREGKKT